MKQIQERLSTYVDRLERLGGRFADDGVMLSTSITERELLVDGDDDRITKDPVLYPLFKHNMFYLVTVPAGTVVTPHAHDEDIFRLIVKGSLLLNKKYRIEAGTWFAIRAGSKYEITTEEGYLSLAGYTSNCRTRRMATGLHGVRKVEMQPPSKAKKASKKK
jgi:quercetin dioxygenase-like cupin family protein